MDVIVGTGFAEDDELSQGSFSVLLVPRWALAAESTVEWPANPRPTTRLLTAPWEENFLQGRVAILDGVFHQAISRVSRRDPLSVLVTHDSR